MGCFSTCFPKSKHPKSLKPRTKTPCLNQLLQRDEEAVEALQLTEIEEDTTNILQIKEDVESEKLKISGRKKVTFDLNVKIYERLPHQEEPEGDFLVNSCNDEDEQEGEKKKNSCHSDSSSSSSLFSFPPDGYRYQNCRDSDDEFEQLVSDDESDLDSYFDDDDEDEEEVNNDHLIVKEESSESLFSLSVDSRKHKLCTEIGEKEVNSPMPVKPIGLDEDIKIKNFDSVLNPVENLTQWKAIKARAKLASQNKAKENRISNHEIAVDTSLSTWLVGTEAVTSAISAGSTPGKSPSRSPDDMPIIGSVGSYWNHTGQNTSSNKRRSKLNINSSTTFEKRLESVL